MVQLGQQKPGLFRISSDRLMCSASAVRISCPVFGIVFVSGWFHEVAQRLSQGAGDPLQIGQIKSSLTQLVIGQSCLRTAQPGCQFLLSDAEFFSSLLNPHAYAGRPHVQILSHFVILGGNFNLYNSSL